jgi:AcrR family transcriptional regulator
MAVGPEDRGDLPKATGPPRRRRAEPRRRRQDPVVARSQLLAAGLELVAERSLGDTLGHLRINDLARDAGLTSGAFYHYWDNQDAYRAEVLDALLAGHRVETEPGLFTADDELDPAVTFDAVGRRVQARLLADPGHRLELALWAHDDPAARPRLAARAEEADAAMARTLAPCLARSGRGPGTGWDLAELATATVTLSDGLRTLHLIDPAVVTQSVDGDGRAWNAPGLLALVLLLGGTEPGPAPAAPPTTVGEPTSVEDNPRRRRLVDLGVTAARQRPTGNAFDHIRADDVARRLGLTIGAFYHYWESQDDYRDDLIDALFAAERYVDPGAVATQDQMIGGAEDLDAAIRDTTTWYWSVAAGHPDNRVQFAFHTLDDPYITPRLASWHADLRRAWHQVLDTLLAHFGRNWRDPLGTEIVVWGMSAALDGLIVRHGLDPRGLDPGTDGWTRWGRTCQALVMAGSAPEGDDRDLPTLAKEALAG